MFDDLTPKNNNNNKETEDKGANKFTAGNKMPSPSPLPDVKNANDNQNQFAGSQTRPTPINQIKGADGNKLEDIFSETEAAGKEMPKPEVFKPKEPQSPAAAGERGADDLQEEAKSAGAKKLLVLAAIIVGLGVIILGGFWLVSGILDTMNNTQPVGGEIKEEAEPASQNIFVNESEEENVVKEPAIETEPVVNQPLDSDQDGLTDEEEEQLNTDINSVDSDDDGLFDREEVKVYKTDPLDADTDGDGYLDGAEVKNNYNPLGPGKLYEID